MVTIHSPEPDFAGEVAGVRFSGGSADLDSAAAHAPAALAYFRRRGYRVTETAAAEEQLVPVTGEQDPADAFNPGAHNVPTVVAYLDEADDDERARVLAAEAAGKARATILEKGNDQ
ncbi:hypothetical protein ABT024_06865 [Streptomyces sp. NPDC002812]|uniref:hypothetical protein n=1 Tax=Streptomyces sp. NPDC002812 TaxID=3154434 RepID=UPI00332A6FB8